MLTLFSYPDLYGVPDNNPYGLKVYAFLKLCKLAFRHEHIFDTKNAPRGQLPYLLDGEKTIGDSDAIISHLIARYALPIDNGLMASQRNTDLLVRRMLEDLNDDRPFPGTAVFMCLQARVHVRRSGSREPVCCVPVLDAEAGQIAIPDCSRARLFRLSRGSGICLR
jgi:glutathione S-transferase